MTIRVNKGSSNLLARSEGNPAVRFCARNEDWRKSHFSDLHLSRDDAFSERL